MKFIQQLLDRKDEFKESEAETLLLKKTEQMLLAIYKKYQMTFNFCAFGALFFHAVNPKFGLATRLLPPIISIPFLVTYQHTIGHIGVRRRIDYILDILDGSDNPKAALEKGPVCKVRKESIEFR